ncbi:MAG: hypothetical protein E7662_00085 [Ruminococcaceae bacterium]|nr:hypothetical protein [Oscillospiraceae bacterium]
MTKSILNQIAGWRTVTVPEQSAAEALSILQTYRYSHWNMKRAEHGSVSFRMTSGDCNAFLKLCSYRGIQAEESGLRGIPELLRRYRGRWGIPAGILTASLIIWLSTSVVWSIEITGNKTVPETQIREILRECGFTEGVRFGNVDFDLFQNNVLMTTDAISWIAVNMYGTKAKVEVRENISRGSSADTATANIIAAEDGQITEVRLKRGRAAVTIHDVVRKGELLISGIMTVRDGEMRYEHADGEVIAQVQRQIVTEVPLKQETKVYTGEESEQKTLIFFGKQINFFQKGGIETPTYDTIIESVRLHLPGGIELPLWIQTERQRVYRTEPEIMSAEQAYELAQNQFRIAVGELLKDVEILSLESTAVLEDGVCRITGDAVCLRNIAQTVEIPIS